MANILMWSPEDRAKIAKLENNPNATQEDMVMLMVKAGVSPDVIKWTQETIEAQRTAMIQLEKTYTNQIKDEGYFPEPLMGHRPIPEGAEDADGNPIKFNKTKYPDAEGSKASDNNPKGEQRYFTEEEMDAKYTKNQNSIVQRFQILKDLIAQTMRTHPYTPEWEATIYPNLSTTNRTLYDLMKAEYEAGQRKEKQATQPQAQAPQRQQRQGTNIYKGLLEKLRGVGEIAKRTPLYNIPSAPIRR